MDAILYEKLKLLRYEIAKKRNIPVFIVFHNISLEDMCKVSPRC